MGLLFSIAIFLGFGLRCGGEVGVICVDRYVGWEDACKPLPLPTAPFTGFDPLPRLQAVSPFCNI